MSAVSLLGGSTLEEWARYFRDKDEVKKIPDDLLIKAADEFKEEQLSKYPKAIDLGCGIGNETAELVHRGWHVIALDALECTREYLFSRIDVQRRERLEFVCQRFEEYTFPENIHLVNSIAGLPFCQKDQFDRVMQAAINALVVGGRFVGLFFGIKDDWYNVKKEITFLTKDQLLAHFKEKCVIEHYAEIEVDKPNAGVMKHYHMLQIIAKKVEKHVCDVAIVGAGLAGLTAADYLKEKGYKVMVLEAQPKVGGRVLTCHPTEGSHFELGAFSFGNKEQPLWSFVQRFALPIVKHSPIEQRMWFRDWKGKVKEKGDFLKGDEKEIPLNHLMGVFLPKLEKLIEANEDDISVQEALQRVGVSDEAIACLQHINIAGLLGDGLSSLSLRSFLSFWHQYDDCSEFYAIKGGNDQLPLAIADQLMNENIMLNCRVQKIEQLAGKCLIYTPKAVIEAKKAIMAVPLHAMGKIIVEPPLSLSKQEAMQSIRYTACGRISIIAPSAILGEAPRGGIFLISDRFGWFREQSAFQIDPQKNVVLNASVVAEQARELSALSKEQWQKLVDEVLLRLYQKWDSQQAEYYTHFWPEGGYSSFPPGKWHLLQTLRQSEGHLHFAGEHTTEKFASMNGAMTSGLRAAEEIHQIYASHNL